MNALVLAYIFWLRIFFHYFWFWIGLDFIDRLIVNCLTISLALLHPQWSFSWEVAPRLCARHGTYCWKESLIWVYFPQFRNFILFTCGHLTAIGGPYMSCPHKSPALSCSFVHCHYWFPGRAASHKYDVLFGSVSVQRTLQIKQIFFENLLTDFWGIFRSRKVYLFWPCSVVLSSVRC